MNSINIESSTLLALPRYTHELPDPVLIQANGFLFTCSAEDRIYNPPR